MMKIFRQFLLVLILSGIFINNSYAIMGDQIDITSEELIVDQNNLTSIFQKNVIVYFDQYKISTEKLVVYYDKKNKTIDKIIIPGKIKLVKTCADETAMADQALYQTSLNQLTLMGNVIINQKGHILNTEKIIYYTKSKPLTKLRNAK